MLCPHSCIFTLVKSMRHSASSDASEQFYVHQMHTIDLIINIDHTFAIKIDMISGFNVHTLKIQTITHTHTHTHTHTQRGITSSPRVDPNFLTHFTAKGGPSIFEWSTLSM